MIACLCRAVSHRTILKVIQDGAATVEQVTARCAAGGDCGACVPLIEKLLREEGGPSELSCAKGCAELQPPVDAAA